MNIPIGTKGEEKRLVTTEVAISFLGNEGLADSVNHLLVVGFYLVNVGFVSLALKYGAKAVDAQSALRYLRTGTFDLIILDINLPDLSGWDVLRIARREHLGAGQHRTIAPQSPNIPQIDTQPEENLPIVVVSAVRVSPRRLSEFRPLAYLPKPFPMEALLRLAWEAAEHRGKTHSQSGLASEATDQSEMDEDDVAPHDVMLPSREEES